MVKQNCIPVLLTEHMTIMFILPAIMRRQSSLLKMYVRRKGILLADLFSRREVER